MNTLLYAIATGLAAYLLGAIPFGLLIARWRGVDIRAVGSRNIGATNVFRSVGKGWGIATFILDMGKGWCGAVAIPALAARLLDAPPQAPDAWRLLGGICAVVGHTWPVYLRFKGGKGVATSAGVLLGAAARAAAAGLAAGLAGTPARSSFSSRFSSRARLSRSWPTSVPKASSAAWRTSVGCSSSR